MRYMNIQASERSALAAKVNVSDAYLYQCLTGRKAMNPEEAVRVERESGHQVRRWHLRQENCNARRRSAFPSFPFIAPCSRVVRTRTPFPPGCTPATSERSASSRRRCASVPPASGQRTADAVARSGRTISPRRCISRRPWRKTRSQAGHRATKKAGAACG